MPIQQTTSVSQRIVNEPLELIDGIFTVGSKYLLGDTSGNGTLSLDAQPADAKEHVYLPYIVR